MVIDLKSPLFSNQQHQRNLSLFFIFALILHALFLLSFINLRLNFDFTAYTPKAFEPTTSIDINLNQSENIKASAKPKKEKSPVKSKTEALEKESIVDKTTKTKSSSTAQAQPFSTNKIYASYPPLAEEMQIEGTVYMKFLVDKIGKVLDVRVTKSSGSKLLDDAAVEALKTAESFNPAVNSKGQAVSAWGEYSIRFSLTEES